MIRLGKEDSMSAAKKTISALLSVVMLATILFSSGIAYAMKKPGRIDGVDYTRINENKDLCVEVEFQLGTTKFKGELSNGNTLSNDEIDQIIKQVMNQMEMTSGKLGYSEAVIEKAKHLKGFDPAMALRIGLNVAGFGTVADIYDMYTGSKEVTDVAASFVIGQLSGEAVKFITGAKWADIALNAFLATKDIAEEWTRLENEKEIAEQAMQRELLLEMFYRECNARLKKAEKERGGNQWKLKVNDSKLKHKTLFGIEINQIQWLKDHPDYSYEKDCADATAIAEAMKAEGWEFASHTWGHINPAAFGYNATVQDTTRWLENVAPIVGDTDVLIFAFGADIHDWRPYTHDNEIFDYLKGKGFSIYCNVDSSQVHWVQFGDDYMRQGRRNLDGYRMYYSPELIADLFDVEKAWDKARPTPVPEM